MGTARRSAGRATLAVNPVDNVSNTLVVDYAHYDGSSVNPVLYSAYAPFSTYDIQRTIYVGLPSIGGALAALTVNVPKAIVSGVELDGQINPVSWLTLGASMAYTDAKFTQNQVNVFGTVNDYGPFADSPRWTGAVYAEASQPLPNDIGTLSLRTDVYSQSLFYFGSLNDTITPGTELPSYTLVNVRLGLANIEHSGVSVAGSVHNLTNRVYYIGGEPLGNVLTLNSANPGAPRTYSLELSYKF